MGNGKFSGFRFCLSLSRYRTGQVIYMGKKAVSALLALVFAVSLLSALPVTADAEGDKEITDIELTVALPKAGDPIVTGGEYSAQFSTPEYVYDYAWYRDTGSGWAYGTFEKGKVYNLSFRIYPKEGYRISSIGDVHVTVNGDSNIYESFHNWSYQCEIVTYVVPIPDPDDPFYSVTVDNGKADKILARAGETVTVTAAHREYYSFVNWQVDEGGVTLEDKEGAKTSFVMGDRDVSLNAIYRYTGPLLTQFNVYVTPPVAGEHPQAPTVESDNYEVSAYSWVRITSEDSGKMTEEDVFEEGSGILYQCRVDLKTKIYQVDDADKLRGFVNDETSTGDGMEVKIYRSSFEKVKVVGSFNCAPAPLEFIVHFDANGGVLNSASATAVDLQTETDGTIGMMPFPTRDGADFEGWFTEKDGGEKVTSTTVFSADTTVYAHWKETADPPSGEPGQPDPPAGPADPAVPPETRSSPFVDVKEGDYFHDPVLWAFYADPQITDGMDDTHFGPDLTVTRGQCVTFLWRAMGKPEPAITRNPFADVPASQYYYKAVLWAVEKGITAGVDDNHFAPNMTLSTAHIITFLDRALGIGTDGWYQEAAGWAAAENLLDGTGLTVAPKVSCPRGAVVTFLYKVFQ